jgi:hypothetical protein
MNTNRDASQRTQYNKTKTLATYAQTTANNINLGNVVLAPGRYSDKTAGIHTKVVVGQSECCANTITGPTYTTYYLSFTTTGSTTWTAPATCQSPITYWIVGGGGGGGGASDNSGGGGGGGGVTVTGTRAVIAGTTYAIVVGAGGAGGTGRGSTYPNPNTIPGTNTDGIAGTASSFDLAGGGPVAAGGGEGKKRDTVPQGQGGAISTGGNGSIGGGKAGGGGGAGGAGTNATSVSPGTGGPGISFTIPGYNGGNSQSYGTGGNGGANITPSNFTYTVGANGAVNTGNGGGGGGAASYAPALDSSTPVLVTIGGAGGSGLVVIQYSA